MAADKKPPKARTNRTRHRARKWQERWLEAFRVEGTVKAACEAAGVGRTTVYEERQANEEFALAWHDIEEETTEMMEREAIRRAAEGVVEPVVSAGKHVTDVRRYSDQLLQFMLRARKPEVYSEKTRHEHTGANGGPITFADLAATVGEDV